MGTPPHILFFGLNQHLIVVPQGKINWRRSCKLQVDYRLKIETTFDL